MPEGHTIHALARRLDRAFAQDVVRAESPQGRFDAEAALIDGTTYERAEALGKHLAIHFEGERVVHVHLGLFGKLGVRRHGRSTRLDDLEVPVEGQVRLRLLGPSHVADLRGATTCELLTPQGWAAKAARVGADPLRRRSVPAATVDRILASRRPVGQLIMDQSLIAGVGNVYRAELLHRLRLDPYQPGRALTDGVVRRLWEELVRLMPLGVETGRILVDDDDVRGARRLLAEGRSGRIRPTYAVYRRHGLPCPRCGVPVARAELAGRNLFWCPGCQVGLPDLTAATVTQVVDDLVLELVRARPQGSVCPSEVARGAAVEVGTPGWRDLMPLVRERAVDLAGQDGVRILRRGEPVPLNGPGAATVEALGAGPIRLAVLEQGG
jgi:endonuclease VIII